ncbi:MAG: DUF3052 domain-containing protein [Bacteroidota bacterium]
MPTAGYSGTPLAKKLGIKTGFAIWIHNQPEHYLELFDDLPDDLDFVNEPKEESLDFIHLFVKEMAVLSEVAPKAKGYLKKNGTLWVSWPKGASKISTDLSRDPIREYLLGIGLVDVKVAAVDENWSGLKFVYRVKDR